MLVTFFSTGRPWGGLSHHFSSFRDERALHLHILLYLEMYGLHEINTCASLASSRACLSLSHSHVAGFANPASDVHMDLSYRGSRSRCLVLRMVLLLARVRYATGHSVEIPLEAYNVDVVQVPALLGDPGAVRPSAIEHGGEVATACVVACGRSSICVEEHLLVGLFVFCRCMRWCRGDGEHARSGTGHTLVAVHHVSPCVLPNSTTPVLVLAWMAAEEPNAVRPPRAAGPSQAALLGMGAADAHEER